MSNQILPLPRGLGWDIKRTPNFSTLVQRAVSGRETRSPLYQNPLWDFEFVWNYLKNVTTSSPSWPSATLFETAPLVAGTAGGSLPATTYYVTHTWLLNDGETQQSGEAVIALGAGQQLNVQPAIGPPTGAIGWNVYVGLWSGGEIRQNAFPLQILNGVSEYWVMPTTGLQASRLYAAQPENNGFERNTVGTLPRIQVPVGQPVVDGWIVHDIDNVTGTATPSWIVYWDNTSGFPFTGTYCLELTNNNGAGGGVTIPANTTWECRVFSRPFKVIPGQVIQLGGQRRIDAATSPPAGITIKARIGMVFFDVYGTWLQESYVDLITSGGGWSQAQTTANVPSNAVYAVLECCSFTVSANGTPTVLPAASIGDCRFDNMTADGMGLAPLLLTDSTQFPLLWRGPVGGSYPQNAYASAAKDAVSPYMVRPPSQYEDLRSLLGFYLARQGPYDSFLFVEPFDAFAADTILGIGDGSTVNFQLLRNYGGFFELIQNPLQVSIFFNGFQQSSGYTVGQLGSASGGVVTFATAPASGVQVAASFSHFHRLRFKEDSQEFNQFMTNLYEIKSLTATSVKL